MNVLSKLYSIISKFNSFIELKKNCGGGKCRKKNEISSSSFALV